MTNYSHHPERIRELQNRSLNSYLNGYAAIPVILACKNHGLFKVLNSARTISLTGLVRELNANSRHLQVALHLLESLNFISRNKNDEYSLTPASDVHKKIPKDIMKLMSFPMNYYLKKDKKSNLKKWIDLSARRWDVNDIFADLLDGMLIIPLFLALQENGLISSSDKQAPLKLDPAINEEIVEFLSIKGLVSQIDGIAYLNDNGCLFIEILHKASVARYRPMLISLSEGIFVNDRSALERDFFHGEQHVDNTPAMIVSEFQQDEYASQLEEIIISIFNQKPYSEQPKYIAEMGCGDGRFLKKIYEIVKTKSLRGRVLDAYPIKVIGIDMNQNALKKTSQTLQDVDHVVLGGDIGDPAKMINELRSLGIADVEKILHICFSLDHKRYILPSETSETANKSKPGNAVYVDREGSLIPEALITQSLAEHFNRWASIPSNHGLIILEEHCLDLKTAREFADRTGCLYFDICHGFSQQMPVEADIFLMAAAEASLFPKPDSFKKYPQTMPFTRMTVNHFERRDYRVRCAQEKDLPILAQLESQCWAPKLRSTVSVLKKRLKQYPQGQLVLEIGDRVVGVIYSQRIANPEEIKTCTMRAVERLHQPDQAIVQLMAVNILPELQYRNLGDELLEYMLQLCSVTNGIDKVIAVTRCKDYHKHTNINLQEYISYRNEQGRLVDTILRFHELHGAQIKELVPGYRPQDKVNQGCGVLVEYDLCTRQRKDFQVYDYSGRNLVPQDSRSIKDFVVRTIISVLGPEREEGFGLDRPMMEMGLDSPDLLELKEKIAYQYQIKLRADFFFRYKTPERVIDYLEENIELETAQNIGKAKEDRSEGKVFAQNPEKQDIAIIGVSCRLPGSVMNKEQLWELLQSGQNAIGTLPEKRWDWPGYIDSQKQHQGIDRGGFLDDIAGFDAYFFRISPKEAELMDPQQRIMMELCWECLEDAGYSATAVSGSQTGVFIGASGSDYHKLLDSSLAEVVAHYNTGTSMAVLPNRISYFYDFNGPSLQIDTACSSSLVAVHEAVKSLKAGECTQALVGGINIICHPSASIAFYKAGMLSKDGKCKTFDKDANGYVRSEGGVMILLKPLDEALADNDTVYAVIKGTAINHGGLASGLTVPNPSKQAALLIETYRTAGIEPETVGYIEAHGTGTPLGDPIEIGGLKEAFDQLSGTKEAQEPYCGLGSIKTNLGHLEAAAGIAGLLKVVLCLQNHILPASLSFNELNPHILLEQTPFYVVGKNQLWPLPYGQSVRRAGVSSFGSGGANAHAVLEEAPIIAQDHSTELPCYLICLSAKTEQALRQKEIDFLNWLEKGGHQNSLFDISASLLLGREHFKLRTAYLVRDVKEILIKFNEVWEKGSTEGHFRNRIDDHGEPKQSASMNLGKKILAEMQANNNISKQDYVKKLTVLTELYLKGYDLEWRSLFSDKPIHRIKLPTYPFNQKRYWVPETNNKTIRKALADDTINPLLQKKSSDLSNDIAVPSYATSDDPLVGEIKLVPVWDLISPEKDPIFPSAADRVIVIGGEKDQRSAIQHYFPQMRITGILPDDTIDSLAEQLETYGTIDHIIWIAPSNAIGAVADDALIEEQDQGVIHCFRLIKALLRLGYGKKELSWTVITAQTQPVRKNDLVNPAHASLYGLIGSMAKEYRNWKVRLVDLEPSGDWPLEEIFALPADPLGNAFVYRGHEWYRQKLTPLKYTPPIKPVYRAGGVYVIIGGAGGIGEVWSEYMICHYKAQIIWIGRRKKDKVIQSKLSRLSDLGPAPMYISADASDRKSLQRAYTKIKQDYPQVHGVVHAAIVLSDHSLANMEEEQFRAALSAKIDVSVRMAQIFHREPLDFILFFSSILSYTKAPGQSNYASGCTFSDIFAHHLRGQLPYAVKVINWGYWGSVGIVASKAYQERMKKAGIGSIEPVEAMEGLATLLAGPIDQMIHMKMMKPQAMNDINEDELVTVYPQKHESSIENIKKTVLNAVKNRGFPDTINFISRTETDSLTDIVQRALIKTVSNLLEVQVEDIDASTDLKEFGFDHFKLADFIIQVNKEYDLKLTLNDIYDHNNLSSFAAYLVLEHQIAFRKYVH